MAKVAFIGLGVMGYPMAGHLAAAGHEVRVFNRSGRKADNWISEHSGTSQPTPRAAAVEADIVFTCVGNDADLRAVTLGDDGVFAGMKPGGCFVDHTTTSATVARELSSRAVDLGIEFVDAPVSGGQSGAETGGLTVMCGGSEHAFERVHPVIDAYARACVLMGAVGAGQLTKMVNQICIAGLLEGLAEGLNFGRCAGLDIDKLVAVISKGAAQSWQMDNRAATMSRGEFDFGFAVDWMSKDLTIVLDEARHNGANLPVTALVDELYSRLQQRGHGRWDTSSLIALLREP